MLLESHPHPQQKPPLAPPTGSWSVWLPVGRFYSAMAQLALALSTLGAAHAADVSVTPAAGDGFVVNSAGGERLRVQSDGTATLPAVPGAAVQPNALCISAGGQLGPCGPGGGVSGGSYTAGTGLGLVGNAFSLAPGYRLPQGCGNNQVVQWNGAGWACATPASAGGLPACIEGEIFRIVGGALQCSALPSTFTTVTNGGGNDISIALGADGFPVISYFEGTSRTLKVAKCGSAACSRDNTVTTVDSAGHVGQYSSIALGANGFPMISYYDSTRGALKFLRCGDAICLGGNATTTVDGFGGVGKYSSIALGADGLPVISYYDETNGDLKVAKCATESCFSNNNTITTVDSTGNVGRYTSISLGADGFPVISYYDDTNEDLKVVRCENAECSAWLTTTVDSAGRVGEYSSITLGADGSSVISYYDFTNGALKVLRCGNADCDRGNTITTVDGSTRMDSSTSIALGADDFPIISYSNLKDLKVAKCSNARCSASTISRLDSTGNYSYFTSSSIAVATDGLPVIGYSSNTDLKVVKCSSISCRQP